VYHNPSGWFALLVGVICLPISLALRASGAAMTATIFGCIYCIGIGVRKLAVPIATLDVEGLTFCPPGETKQTTLPYQDIRSFALVGDRVLITGEAPGYPWSTQMDLRVLGAATRDEIVAQLHERTGIPRAAPNVIQPPPTATSPS
jgi:hypothetical protein